MQSNVFLCTGLQCLTFQEEDVPAQKLTNSHSKHKGVYIFKAFEQETSMERSQLRYLEKVVNMLPRGVVLYAGVRTLPHHVIDGAHDVCHLLEGKRG